jgi:hypothetical protein
MTSCGNRTFVRLDAIKVKGRDFTLWDDALMGFDVRVRPTGARSFVSSTGPAQGAVRRCDASPSPLDAAAHRRETGEPAVVLDVLRRGGHCGHSARL